MSDETQDAARHRLVERFAGAKKREASLLAEVERITGWIGEARNALGNPFFYSGLRHARPENAEKSEEKFSGYASHEVGLRLAQDLRNITDQLSSVREELSTLRKKLRDAGSNVD